MISMEGIGMVAAKVVKLVLNLIILVIYAKGNNGNFLGVGGEWDLNEPRTADIEIVTSGIYVVFFIYTTVVLISYALGELESKKTLVELIMNFVGVCAYILVGGIALHYWTRYQPTSGITLETPSEQIWGIILGVLSILSGLVYIVDLGLTGSHFYKYDQYD